MNFRTIKVVISREYATRVKKKSFLITTFLVPFLFAAVCCIPALILMFNKDEAKTIAVVDESGIVMPALHSDAEVQWVDCGAQNIDSLKAAFNDLDYSALVHVSPINEEKSVAVSTYATKPMGISVIQQLESTVNDAVQDYRIEQYQIDDLKNILEQVRPDITVKSYTISEDGEDRISNATVYMILSMGLGIIIFMFVTLFSSAVMQSVVEEKQSKVVEVLLSSVKAIDLMFGKIIGVALVALTQFLLWIVLTMVIVSAVMGIVGKDKLMGNAIPTEMVDPSAIAGLDSSVMGGVDTAALAAQDPTELQEIMQTISGINITELLVCFLVFFLFGYLLYASLFAAIGSAVESVEDSNSLQMPLTVPLMLAYFIALYSWNAPDSALAVWGSMIPFTSPIVMLARIPFGVPVWQIILSVAILVLTFFAMAWVSAKIYRIGILTSGKKANWKDIWRWLTTK